jgi:hypothetical protein
LPPDDAKLVSIRVLMNAEQVVGVDETAVLQLEPARPGMRER